METLEKDTITPIEWLKDDDVQKSDTEKITITMWQTYSTYKDDPDDTNDDWYFFIFIYGFSIIKENP